MKAGVPAERVVGSAFEGSRPDTYQRVGVILDLLNFDSPDSSIHQNHARTTSPDRDRLVGVQAQVSFPFCQRAAFDH